MKKFLFAILFTLVFLTSQAEARPHRVGQIPNGSKNSCANCHINPAGGGERNDFGKLVEARFLDVVSPAGNVQWEPAIAHLDADGDGVSNGLELQDEFGMWQSGQVNPGNSSLVSLPGLNSSNPLTPVTINFSDMEPHLNQTLFIRIVDIANSSEMGRRSESINSSEFDVVLQTIIPGRSYFIDFFADANSNGFYDPPPTDHTWRLELNNASGNDVLDFSHNTSFTDIDWQYTATINFSSMNPHLNQLIELRAVDQLTGTEAGRSRLERITTNEFSMLLTGLEADRDYDIEFYADLNGDGNYDPPPVDHAWKINTSTNLGSTEINFSHNTDFHDIAWDYVITVDFTEMSPHIDQLFELRVVEQASATEIGRTRFDRVPGSAFSTTVSGIEPGKSYNIDFYADLNASGQYDPPPTDHAWRINFNAAEGNNFKIFSHNTNFTDIEWPDVTSVDGDEFTVNEFKLFQNYPNPFNPETTIKFVLNKNQHTSLAIYDMLGRETVVLLNEFLTSGNYSIRFSAENLPSGVYLYRLKSGSSTKSKKMILLR